MGFSHNEGQKSIIKKIKDKNNVKTEFVILKLQSFLKYFIHKKYKTKKIKIIPPTLTPIQSAETKDSMIELNLLGFSKKIIAKNVFIIKQYIKIISLLL